MQNKMIIAMNLKWYRYQKHQTQEEFYEHFNLNYKYMSRIENGLINLSIDFLEAIAKKLGTTTIDLITYNPAHEIKQKRIDSLKN